MNTARGEASLIEKLFTPKVRSSFGKLPAFAANTTPATGVGGAVIVALLFVGLPAVNTVPDPSSLIVAVAVAL